MYEPIIATIRPRILPRYINDGRCLHDPREPIAQIAVCTCGGTVRRTRGNGWQCLGCGTTARLPWDKAAAANTPVTHRRDCPGDCD